jgi:hypothetical protein
MGKIFLDKPFRLERISTYWCRSIVQERKVLQEKVQEEVAVGHPIHIYDDFAEDR